MTTNEIHTWPPRGRTPWPAHVVVADTNVLASAARWVAEHPDATGDIERLAGGARVLVASHVPHEMPRAIARVCRGVREDDALGAWADRVAPLVTVVELPVAAHLDPSFAHVLRTDPDDVPTAALASFFAPAVVLTHDHVFADAGMDVPEDPRQAVLAVLEAYEQEGAAYTAAAVGVFGARGGREGDARIPPRLGRPS